MRSSLLSGSIQAYLLCFVGRMHTLNCSALPPLSGCRRIAAAWIPNDPHTVGGRSARQHTNQKSTRLQKKTSVNQLTLLAILYFSLCPSNLVGFGQVSIRDLRFNTQDGIGLRPHEPIRGFIRRLLNRFNINTAQVLVANFIRVLPHDSAGAQALPDISFVVRTMWEPFALSRFLLIFVHVMSPTNKHSHIILYMPCYPTPLST